MNLLKPFSMHQHASSPPASPSSRPQGPSCGSTPGSLTPPPLRRTPLQMGGKNSAFTPTRGAAQSAPGVDAASEDEINVHDDDMSEDERLDVVGDDDVVATAGADPERPAAAPPQLTISAAERIAAWRQAELASRLFLQQQRN